MKKKKLDPNSVPTQPELENSRKNSKKIKKVNSGVISIQNGLRETKKEKKKILDPNYVPTQPRLENSRKNSKKIQKNVKPLPGIIFSQYGMR